MVPSSDRDRQAQHMTLALRSATVDDIPFLTQVFLESLRESITAARGEWDRNREIAQFQRQLDLTATNLIVCDGIDVGFVMTPESEQEIQIHTVCVSPPHQRRGIGSEVTLSVVARAQATNRATVLSVLKTNPRARAFYERLGFRVADESDHHYHMTHQGQ